MKLILTLFMLILPITSPMQEAKDVFIENIDNSYESYIKTDIQTNYIDLTIIQGVVNNKVTYGIFFFNDYSKQNTISLHSGSSEYKLPTNSRGDVSITALDLEVNKVYDIIILDQHGFIQSIDTEELKIISVEEFLENENIINGNNSGTKITKLEKEGFSINLLDNLFIIGSVGIVLLCGIILLIYKKSKKGMFAEEAKKENVFDFKEFINSTINSSEVIDGYGEYVNENDDIDEPKDIIDETPVINDYKQVYRRYGRGDEDERSEFNIESYLQSEGFITDYKAISLEEKNQIMIELMKLRDANKITQDDYLDEISKLWKS